jgi:hypothetical protein
MSAKRASCFNCGESRNEKLTKVYGYIICHECKSNLGLFKDETIAGHITKKYKTKAAYAKEVAYRLNFIEKDFIKKKIKLLHILDRLQ